MSKPYFVDDLRDVKIFNEDMFFCGLCEESVDLVVTSPPYGVNINYTSVDDEMCYEKWRVFSRKWLGRVYSWVKGDGRLCVNVPLQRNYGGQYPVCSDIIQIAMAMGWYYRGTIIWHKGNVNRRTAWGSWLSASAPYVIAPVEVIVVFSKGEDWKKRSGSQASNIMRDEFVRWTNGVWDFPGQSKNFSDGMGDHPAPFPVELPRRCIKMFSFVGDTVLDPFLGSGSTLVAGVLNKRKCIGIEIAREYCDVTVNRLVGEAHLTQGELSF